MRCNIYKDQLESAELFGKPVLYTGLSIERESVPDNWFCYDLAASDRNPDKAVTLEDHVVWNRVGTVLSPVPLKRETTMARQIKNSFHLHEELLDLAGFCEKNHLDYPQDPRKYVLRPASPGKEAGLFYSLMDLEKDAASGTVGHMRFYFRDGRFNHSWWPHNDDQFNTPKFKEVLQEFVNELLARGPLKNESTMRRWCYGYPEGKIGRESVGFIAETADYRFCLRCTTDTSDYGYLYCYDLNQQKLAMEQEQHCGFSAEGLQQLQNTADPSIPHTYKWYLLRDSNMPEEQMFSGLSLEEAVELYAASDSRDKHLGVTKDGIASVDLLITHDDREWYSEDYQKSDSFKADRTIIQALEQIHQTLDAPAQGMTMGGM